MIDAEVDLGPRKTSKSIKSCLKVVNNFPKILTVWNVSVFEVILVRIRDTRIEYGEMLRISPYSVQMLENTDQNNSEYWHFLPNGFILDIWKGSEYASAVR